VDFLITIMGVPDWYAAIIIASLSIMILGPRLFGIDKLSKRTFLVLILFFFIVSRLGSFFLLYFEIGYGGTGDLNNVFYLQARTLIEGGFPYVDFSTNYSPYFCFLIALPLLLWNDPIAINLVFFVFDFLTLLVGYKLVSRYLNESNTRTFVWFYSFIPLSWLFIVYWNQDEVLLSFFLLTAAYLLSHGREKESAVTLGIGFLFTKFLFIVFCLPLVIYYRKPIRSVLVATFIVLIGYIPFILTGADILIPLKNEAGYGAVGSNPWVILESLGIQTGILPHVISLGGLGILFVLCLLPTLATNQNWLEKPREWGERILNLGMPGVMILFSLTFMLLSKKSFSFYSVIFVAFLLVVIIQIDDNVKASQKTAIMVKILFYSYIALISALYLVELTIGPSDLLSISWIAAIGYVSIVIFIQVVMIHLVLRILKDSGTDDWIETEISVESEM